MAILLLLIFAALASLGTSEKCYANLGFIIQDGVTPSVRLPFTLISITLVAIGYFQVRDWIPLITEQLQTGDGAVYSSFGMFSKDSHLNLTVCTNDHSNFGNISFRAPSCRWVLIPRMQSRPTRLISISSMPARCQSSTSESRLPSLVGCLEELPRFRGLSLGILMSGDYNSQRFPMVFHLVFIGSATCYNASGPCLQTSDALAHYLRAASPPAHIWWILNGPEANLVALVSSPPLPARCSHFRPRPWVSWMESR